VDITITITISGYPPSLGDVHGFSGKPVRKRGRIPMAMLENYDSPKPTSHSCKCISKQMPSTTLDCHAMPSRWTFVEKVETIKAQDIRPTR